MKVTITPYICMLIFLFSFLISNAQKYQLSTISNNSKNIPILKGLTYQKYHSHKDSIFYEISVIQNQLEKMGYLNVKVDSFPLTDSIYTVYLTLNKLTKKIRINYNNDSLTFPNIFKKIIEPISANNTENYFEIPFSEISNSLEKMVEYYEENGNSFVQVSLSNIHLENEIAMAQLNIHDAKPRTIDKVIIKGYDKFPKNFIKYQLNLKKKSIFNNKKLEEASIATKNLSFAEEQKPPEVLFTIDSTYIYVYLKKKQANRFDGVLGFSSKDEGKGLDFNGYLDFLFNNIFNSGESIALLWKSNSNDSQRFFISAETPYIFNLPIIPKASFEIFRQDSTYYNITTDLAISFQFNNKNRMAAVYNSENSNDLLNTDASFSNINSFKNRFFGGSYSYRLTNNDFLFPEKFNFNFSVFLGNRTSDNIKTNQTKFILNTNYLYSINFKNHFFIKNQSALLNSENYYNNELFQIGGLNTIRGIHEDSILASAYSVFNFEYRFKPSNSSYFFTITDYSYVKNEILNQNINIYSLGLGYALITKLGILNLSYALPKIENNAFKIDAAKVNIKLISIF